MRASNLLTEQPTTSPLLRENENLQVRNTKVPPRPQHQKANAKIPGKQNIYTARQHEKAGQQCQHQK